MIRNEQDQINLRRNQNTLIITGTGMIVFMLWSMVKAFWLLFIRRERVLTELFQIFDEGGFDHSQFSDDTIFLVILVLVALVLALDLLIKLFVGLSAISEGKGKKRGRIYVVLIWILIVVGVCRMIVGRGDDEAASSLNGVLSYDGSIPSMIIELTSLIMMIQMGVDSIKVKMLNRQSLRKKE